VRAVAAGYAAVEGNCLQQLPIGQLELKINNKVLKSFIKLVIIYSLSSLKKYFN